MTALAAARKADAAALVAAQGVPHRRIEDWKYSDLKAALGEAGIGAVVAQWLVSNLPSGIEMFDLAQPNAPAWVSNHFGHDSGNVMSAASLALSAGGVAFRVPANTIIAEPLKLDFTGTGHIRGLLVLEAGASLTLAEGVGLCDFRNVGFEIVLGEGARLEHVRLSPAADAAVLVEELHVRVATGASYRAHYAGFGARLSRVEVDLSLDGAGASAHLSGVAVLGAKRHSDVTVRMNHASGDTNSTQLFKHVVGASARAVYQGKVIVAHGANSSDSNQAAKALLLGETAEADLKPELEIFADDVKCAHGAAVGDLDAESLFYLRARGIPEHEARGLLLQAFLADAADAIADEGQRAEVVAAMTAALEGLA